MPSHLPVAIMLLPNSATPHYARGALYRQPQEIIIHIAEFVDDVDDLHSFSQASRGLHATIVSTRMLEFCRIRCGIHRTYIWEALAKSPYLAAMVRRLEIIDEPFHSGSGQLGARAVIAPAFGIVVSGAPASVSLPSNNNSTDIAPHDLPSGVDATSSNSIASLTRAIRALQNLNTLNWHAADSCPSAGLLQSLSSLRYLRQLRVNYHDRTYSDDSRDTLLNVAQLPLWCLSNLTHFSFTGTVFNQNNPTMLLQGSVTEALRTPPAMIRMLTERCPALEELEITHSNPCGLFDATNLLKNGRWPRLTRLSLGNASRPKRDLRSAGDGHVDAQKLAEFDLLWPVGDYVAKEDECEWRRLHGNILDETLAHHPGDNIPLHATTPPPVRSSLAGHPILCDTRGVRLDMSSAEFDSFLDGHPLLERVDVTYSNSL